MEIVDAQIHELPTPQSLGELNPGQRMLISVENSREALDSVGIDAAVVIAREPYLDACVAAYPERFAGVMVIDPQRLDLEQLITTFRDRPGMRAGRVQVAEARTAELRAQFAEGGYDAALEWAERAGLPLFFTTHGWTRLLAPVAERHPRLSIIVDHLGLVQSPPSPPREDPWRELNDLLDLARFPNVYVKLGGLPLLSREPYPHLDLWPKLYRVIEAFTPGRLMWASDFTRMRLAPQTLTPRPRAQWPTTYRESLGLICDTAELSSADKEEILGRAVRRVLRWERSVSADQVLA
jgi:L-fuconolactonase